MGYLLSWSVEDVRRHMSGAGVAEWFADVDGPELLDLLHDLPYDFVGGTTDEDDDVKDFFEKRLKVLRQHFAGALQRRLGPRQPLLPVKSLHRIMLLRRLLSSAWNAAAFTEPSEKRPSMSDASWTRDDPETQYTAARILSEYGCKALKVQPGNLSDAPSVRALTRTVDALRFALSAPGAVAAAYAYDDTKIIVDGDPVKGKAIFQFAVRHLATTMLEAVKAGLAAVDAENASLEEAAAESTPSSEDSGADDTTTGEHNHEVDEDDDDEPPIMRKPRVALIHETLRLVRSVLCALCALCPEKKDIEHAAATTICRNKTKTSAAGSVARQQLELVCNEVLIPLVFLLEHSVGKQIPNNLLRMRVERAIRGPFASLLYLLSWHDDNLVSLFNTQRNLIVLVALYWLSPPRKRAPVGESERLIRRKLVTVVWSFAKKKDRAVQLATPEMLHPLLNCLDHTENQKDIRFRAAGALEKLLTHRSSLSMMPKDDDGSEIIGSKRDLVSQGATFDDHVPPLLDAVLTKLLCTFGIAIGATPAAEVDDDDTKEEVPPSSDYLQLTLAAAANLSYLAIACEREQPEHARWLSEQLHRRLRAKSREHPTVGDLGAVDRIPELQEPRVHYEALRLLWVLLRLKIHPSNTNLAARSLLEATGLLDVECASAGVIFDDVPPDDLKLHCIQDLLRYIQSPDHEALEANVPLQGESPGSKFLSEPLRAFAAWILAHYSYRGDDSKHITYQSAFVTIARLITDDATSSLYATVLEATLNGTIFQAMTYNAAAAKLLTLRLLTRCLRNLARSDVTATLVVEHTKVGSPGALHALNRLAFIGWCLEAFAPCSSSMDSPPVPSTTAFLSTKTGYYYQELASHETHVDDLGRIHHKCVPIVVRMDHTDPAMKRRVRQAATNARVRFIEKAPNLSEQEDLEDDPEDNEFKVQPGCVPNSISILQETAETLERLAAHNQVRGFFGTHGSLGLVVRLALQKRFSPGVALKVLLDTPRAMLVNHVTVAHAAHEGPGEQNFFQSTVTQQRRRSSSTFTQPRWLVADINELILATLEDAPEEAVKNGSKNDAQVAGLLALQLATSMLAQDDTKKYKQHHDKAIHESPRGKQVILRKGSSGDLVTGICLKVLGPTTSQQRKETAGLAGLQQDQQTSIDVILDSGDLYSGVAAKHVTMAQLIQPRAPRSTTHHRKDDETVAYFVHPSFSKGEQVGSPRGGGQFAAAANTVTETSLFLYFVREADRFFTMLERCSQNVTLAAAACNLCETLSNTLRRYLQSGFDLSPGLDDMLNYLGTFCEKQLARLVGDCACDVGHPDCPDALRAYVGDAVLDGAHGIFFTSLYLLEASVILYKRKQHASCTHRGFTFGIPTLMYNAISALHAQVFDAGLGELTADVQRRVIELSRKIKPPHQTTTRKDDSDVEVDTRSLRLSQDEFEQADEDEVRHGNNLVNSAFRAVLAVLDLARASDVHRNTRQSESQPVLLKEMMGVAVHSKKVLTLEKTSSQHLAHHENAVDTTRGNRRTSRRLGEPMGSMGDMKQAKRREHIREERERHRWTRNVLFGLKGTADLDHVLDLENPASESAKSPLSPAKKWSMNADENPLYSKLRSLCCQVVRLGVGPRSLRLEQDMYAQYSTIRSSLRFLSALGSDLLMARKLHEVPPTAEKRFVVALVRCIKWHPYWTHCQLVKKEEARALRRAGSQHVETPRQQPLQHQTSSTGKRKVETSLPPSQMGDMLAVEACNLVQKLSANLNQRHLMVFPETARKFASVGTRVRRIPSDDNSDDGGAFAFANLENTNTDEMIKLRSSTGCLPVLTLLAGAKGRGDVDILVRAAAVSALKEIASNSTICSEALCAHDGVKQLVTAAHVGNHPLRRNVAYIFSLIAMTPSIREQLLTNYQALLLLLQLQALRDNPYIDDDAQVVACAAKALKYLSTNSALVYLEALKICVKRIDSWKALPERRSSILQQQTDDDDDADKKRKKYTSVSQQTTTIGVALLGPGYQELLQLALHGLGDAASHSEMADVLIGSQGIETLLECLQIRDAGIITTTARTLAALVNHIVAFERRSQSKAIVCRVIDQILLLVWPYTHRAARTLQRLCRSKFAARLKRQNVVINDEKNPNKNAHITLVPVSATLVAMAATAIERVARDHGLGDYLVHQGAVEALAARLTPDAYKHDEEECKRVASFDHHHMTGVKQQNHLSSMVHMSASSTSSSTLTAQTSENVTKRDDTRKGNKEDPAADPPIVRVLSAIAQLAHNAPHCLPAGKTERSLSIVCAFHHNKRCRHLAMLALWRIRPVVNGATAEGPVEVYNEGQDDSVAPPPAVYWDDDDVVTWLGCIGFGSIGKTMRKYLASSKLHSNVEILKSIEWSRSRQYSHAGWTRRSVEKSRDPYGQATAGEKLLALTAHDLQVGGRLQLSESQVRSLELGAFASELRELHLRMREATQDYAYDVRVPCALLEEAPTSNGLEWSRTADSSTKSPSVSPVGAVGETEVILAAGHVRRYRALFAEASAIYTTSDERSGSVDLADLAFEAITEAKRAYDEHDAGRLNEARIAALLAKSAAEKVKDAVALNRVKHASASLEQTDATRRPSTKGGLAMLEDIGDMVLNNGMPQSTEPETLCWSDTLWYELSSAPSVDIFNRSRSITGRAKKLPTADDDAARPPSSSGGGGDLLRESTTSAASSSSDDRDAQQQQPTQASHQQFIDFEEICLWPTEGEGYEAAKVREVRRLKRTPTGVLQKVSKAPIRDKRGLAHLFEVRFIDARVMLPGGKTALMMCAKEGDLAMVQLLLDNVDIQLGEARAAITDTMKYVRQNKSGSSSYWRIRRRRHWSGSWSGSSGGFFSSSFNSKNTTSTDEVPENQQPRENYDPSVFHALELAARPNAVDEYGHTALHHAMRSLLRVIERVSESSNHMVNPEHLMSRVDVVDTLLSRVAVPHSAHVFMHATSSCNDKRVFAESFRGAPNDALALIVLCYGKTQRRRRLREYNITDECAALTNAIEGLEAVAARIDDMIALMFRCGFTFNEAVIREAHQYHLLARLRYLYVQNCDHDAVETLLNDIPSVFLKRNFDVKHHNPDAMVILPKAYTTPWEAPVFGLKKLQEVTQKVWAARMMFRINRQLLGYVIFMVTVLYVAAEIVGMEIFMVSRDAFQQALRTRLVEEEWYPMNGFLEVATPDDWWQWAEGPLLSAIYEPQLPAWQKNGEPATSSSSSEVFPLLGGLAIAIGQPRLRMVATQPNDRYLGGCAYAPSKMRFGRRDSTRCYSFFSESAALDRTLKQDISENVAEALKFKTRTLGWLGIEAPSVYGYQSYYPGSGGYVAALPKDEAEGRQLIGNLKNASWLSQNTRAIMLEFLCYSPSDHHSHNLVTHVRLLAEFSPMGAVLCSGRIRALRLFLYKTTRDYIRLIFELIWLICTFFLFRAEVQQMAASFEREKTDLKRPRFMNQVNFLKHLRRVRRGISNYAVAHFNIFDLFQFHVFIWLLVSHIASIIFSAHVDWGTLVRASSSGEPDRHLSTAAIVVQLAESRLFFLGLYVFLSFLKLLDRMRVRESLHVLIVEEMTKKIFSFLIVMTICVLAFSFTAFFSRLGGAQGPMGGKASYVGGGEAFLAAFVSQMRQLIGEIDYETAYNSDPRFGIIFCIITFLVLPVLLMNLLIAIMLEAYESVRNAAAARYCYLQQVAYVDYFKAHDGPFQTDFTHWFALTVGVIFFPVLVVERIFITIRVGMHYVWTDIFHPERRIPGVVDVVEYDNPAAASSNVVKFLKALRYIGAMRSFNIRDRVRVHPTLASPPGRRQSE